MELTRANLMSSSEKLGSRNRAGQKDSDSSIAESLSLKVDQSTNGRFGGNHLRRGEVNNRILSDTVELPPITIVR